MRSALPLVVFALTGCDLVFGLSGRIGADAADLDADTIDGPMPCTMYSESVVATADTMLLRETDGNCNPSIRRGAYDNINLGQPASANTRSRILLRFPLLPEMLAALQADGGFIEALLRLPLKPEACPGPCPSTALDFAIYAAHNDWNEGLETGYVGASWCARKQLAGLPAILWEMQGADGPSDRSTMPLGTFAITQPEADGDALVVSATPSAMVLQDARTFLDGPQLSLLLVPTSTAGTLYVKAREDTAGGGARLTIRSCR